MTVQHAFPTRGRFLFLEALARLRPHAGSMCLIHHTIRGSRGLSSVQMPALTLTPLYFSDMLPGCWTSATSSSASPACSCPECSRFCITSSPRPPSASSLKISLKFLATPCPQAASSSYIAYTGPSNGVHEPHLRSARSLQTSCAMLDEPQVHRCARFRLLRTLTTLRLRHPAG